MVAVEGVVGVVALDPDPGRVFSFIDSVSTSESAKMGPRGILVCFKFNCRLKPWR
jgi:hypothetical protein